MVTIVFFTAYRKKDVYEESIGNKLFDDTNPLYRLIILPDLLLYFYLEVNSSYSVSRKLL
jgi:hypothetical protein